MHITSGWLSGASYELEVVPNTWEEFVERHACWFQLLNCENNFSVWTYCSSLAGNMQQNTYIVFTIWLKSVNEKTQKAAVIRPNMVNAQNNYTVEKQEIALK